MQRTTRSLTKSGQIKKPKSRKIMQKEGGQSVTETDFHSSSSGKIPLKSSVKQKRKSHHIPESETESDSQQNKRKRNHSPNPQPAGSNVTQKFQKGSNRATRKSVNQTSSSMAMPAVDCPTLAAKDTSELRTTPTKQRSSKKKLSSKKKKQTDATKAPDGSASAKTEDVGNVKHADDDTVSNISTRFKGSGKLVGAHCSIAGSLQNAVKEAVDMGGCAFGLFLRSQRSWFSKPLDPEAAEKFKAACKEHGFPPSAILPHGSYLMNCGSPNADTLRKSRETLLEELQRCEALGLTLYNFHPGSTCGEISVEECLDSIADAINWAHEHTKFVTTVIENMSCQGNTVGGRFEELKGIIDRVHDKARIGVCLDTCHAFAAGFDLSTQKGFDKFVSDFDSIVGFQYLRAMHLNDSKGDVGCHLDRHENIGKGKIGLDGFRRVMQEPRFDGIPMILETPLGDYASEIKILNRLASCT